MIQAIKSPPTRRFHVRTILSVTTRRLITKPTEPRDNGFGEMQDMLSWMTGETLLTSQLPAAACRCVTHLNEWFPELAACNSDSAHSRLQQLIDANKADPDEAIEMWLAEQQAQHPEIQAEYDLPQIPRQSGRAATYSDQWEDDRVGPYE